VPVQYFFRGCTVIIDEERHYVETRFPDGGAAGSTPNDDPHTLDVAAEMGYGTDTWTMSRDHELTHTWLAHVDGLDYSPTMWRIAHPDMEGSIGDVEVSEEEAIVLEFQRQMPKDRPRPWDDGSIRTSDDVPW
jgi:hypothetical protein